MDRRFFPLLACTSAALALCAAGPARAQGGAAVPAQLILPSDGSDANPTARSVTLTVPLRDGPASLGDMIVEIGADDTVALSSGRLLDLLENRLGKEGLRALRQKAVLTAADLAAAGVTLSYNAQELALDLRIEGNRRATRGLQVSDLEQQLAGEALTPARFSGYVNVRGSVDYLQGDGGIAPPVSFIDGAVRAFGIVAEAEALWQPGGRGRTFYRAGSRLVFDDSDRLVRWTAGDLQPVARGFQSLPELAGLSLFRSYNVLQPQRIARPRGGRSFTLTRPSTVEVQVNGQVVRRLQLDPGNYDLRDFPFVQGANDVRLVILDDAGRSQSLGFNVFLDQSQLGSGLTEFGLFAGVIASSGLRGPDYSKEPAITGFIRRGISDSLTLGANVQGDRRSQMGGIEGIWSSALGTISATASLSNLRDEGRGYAGLVTYQRVINRAGGSADALNLFVETRSRNFGALGTLVPFNPFAWDAGGGYSLALTSSIYAGVDGRYSRGRDHQPNVYNARGTLGFRVTDALSLAADLRWEKDNFERRVSGLITATLRIGRYSNLRADYDTRFNRARLSYSTFRGHGVGAYNIVADLDRSDAGAGLNLAANYFANRAELGFSHFGTFENDFGNSLSQRSSLRFGSSLAFADGAVSVGRPIYDSFAVVHGHRSLRQASIEVERTPFGYVAETGTLGTAVHPNLPSYIDHTVAVSAPEAPPTADLGQGAFRLLPAYKSGFLLTVGSAYNVSAVGQLLDAQGEPIPLAGGIIREVGKDRPQEHEIFTNRAGRFGATGLAPGRWQIVVRNGEASTTFTIDIPQDAEGVLTVGELRPSANE